MLKIHKAKRDKMISVKNLIYEKKDEIIIQNIMNVNNISYIKAYMKYNSLKDSLKNKFENSIEYNIYDTN